MVSTIILSALIGFLVGLAFCYWKQIQTAYQNKDVISSGANLLDAANNFKDAVYQKL